MNAQKMLLFEVNEVPFPVLDHYVARHPSSTLAQVMNQGRQFETVCEDQIELDPWISWPTLHRGVRDVEHRILHLSQDLTAANVSFPPIWDLLGRAGVTYGVFGSLHSELVGAPPPCCAFHVPDVFVPDPHAHPDHLRWFQSFNLAMTRKSGRNVDRSIAFGELGRFALQYLARYRRARTMAMAVRVLAAEQVRHHLACRRRSVQPLVAYDVFEKELLRHQPAFATFHTNHVAAALHRYWAAAYPEDIERNQMPEDWRRRYGGEVDFALARLDEIFARMLAGPARQGYKIVFVTSLGQAGVASKPSPGFRTIVDLAAFMRGLRFEPGSWTEGTPWCRTSRSWRPNRPTSSSDALLDLRPVGWPPYRCDNEVPPFTYTRANDGSCLCFEGLCTTLDVVVLARCVGRPCGVGFMPSPGRNHLLQPPHLVGRWWCTSRVSRPLAGEAVSPPRHRSSHRTLAWTCRAT
ncbi:MAG: hypothetical protein R2761_28030 [Acidimicrobiales bacterium]